MNRFLVESISEWVAFSPAQAHQIEHVLRLRPGDRVGAFDGRTPLDFVVELETASSGRVVERCPQSPEPRTRLTAFPALLQRDKFESVLQKLTELGVSAIVPVLTERSLVREAPDSKRLERWRAIMREATEQCGRGRVPEFQAALPFSEAIQQASRTGRVIIAYEREQHHTLAEALRDAGDSVSMFVGPEGGYTAEEAQLATSSGARLVTLGPRILRTETASPVLAALVLYERGDLSSHLE